MKHLTIILFLSVTFNVSAQTEFRAWKVVNRSLIWQQVFEDSSATKEGIKAMLHSTSWVTNVSENGNTFYAAMNDYMIDPRKHGKSAMSLPILYRDGKFKSSIVVDVKEGVKYRVTISTITFDAGEINSGFRDLPISGPLDGAALNKERTLIRKQQIPYIDLMHMDWLESFQKKVIASTDW